MPCLYAYFLRKYVACTEIFMTLKILAFYLYVLGFVLMSAELNGSDFLYGKFLLGLLFK
jgi:hypothetical protein